MKKWMRRILPALVAAGLSTGALAQPLAMVVNEGSAKDAGMLQTLAKYRPLANLLETALKQPIMVVSAATTSEVEAGMKSGRFDLVFVRPADVGHAA